jgi:hypothetical protein
MIGLFEACRTISHSDFYALFLGSATCHHGRKRPNAVGEKKKAGVTSASGRMKYDSERKGRKKQIP